MNTQNSTRAFHGDAGGNAAEADGGRDQGDHQEHQFR